MQFKETYGHTQVPINWENDIQLANWVSTQRQEYQNMLKGKTSRLDKKRMERLNKTGFSWQLQRGGRKRQLQIQRNPDDDVTGKSPPDHPANQKESVAKKLKKPSVSAASSAAARLKRPKKKNQQDEAPQATELASESIARGTDTVPHHPEEPQSAQSQSTSAAQGGLFNDGGNGNIDTTAASGIAAGVNTAPATTSRQTAISGEALLANRLGLSPELAAQLLSSASANRNYLIESPLLATTSNNSPLSSLGHLLQARPGNNALAGSMAGNSHFPLLFSPGALQLPLQRSTVASAVAGITESSSLQRQAQWRYGADVTASLLQQSGRSIENSSIPTQAFRGSLLERLESAKRARQLAAILQQGNPRSAAMDSLLATRAPSSATMNNALPLDVAMELSRLASQGAFHRP